MQKLADLLFKETTQKTKEVIWLEKYKGTKIDTRSLILLDCINRSPIEVLQDVAFHELHFDKERGDDRGELEHYITNLAKSTMSEKEAKEYLSRVKDTIDSTLKERKIEPRAHHQREQIENEIQAYEVARLLGFPVTRYIEAHNLDYYKNILDDLTNEVENISTDIHERGVMNKAFEIFECVLKDLYIFYSYLTDRVLQQSISQDEWKIKLKGILKGTLNNKPLVLGDLYDFLIEINVGSKSQPEKLEALIGQRQFFNDHKLNDITKNGSEKGEFIVTLRNHANHNRYEAIEGKAPLIVKIMKDFLDFLGEENRRVYPYRIYFTILTRTHHGIKTCQYITNLTETIDKNKTDRIEKKIYTEKEIDFQKTYYCLPNTRKCWKNIWVDPLLIPVDNVWYYD